MLKTRTIKDDAKVGILHDDAKLGVTHAELRVIVEHLSMINAAMEIRLSALESCLPVDPDAKEQATAWLEANRPKDVRLLSLVPDGHTSVEPVSVMPAQHAGASFGAETGEG